MISILALVVLLSPLQDDESIRERIRTLVDQLDAELIEDRTKAAKALEAVPARFSPYLAKLGREKNSAQLTAALESLSVPDPWPEILTCTIKDSRAIIERLRKGEEGRPSALVADTLKGLAARPPPDVQRILGVLWASGEPGYRELALDGWAKWPPADLGPVRRLLSDPRTCERAADIVILAGDADAVSDALAAYESRRRDGSTAALRVLARFGVPDVDLDRIVKMWADGLVPERRDFWILGRRGTEKGAKFLADWIRSSLPGADAAVPVLAWIGGESHLDVVRDWAATRVAGKYVPWPLHDPAAALRRFESLGEAPTSQDFIDKLSLAWQAGAELRDPILKSLANPSLKLNHRRVLLSMLGSAGRGEDGALLLESLQDPRLADAAAEALDRMGNPAHAGALFDAFIRQADSRYLGPAVLSLGPDGLEDRIVEVLGDADSYGRQAPSAVILAGRKLTPRLLDALLKAYERSPALVGSAVERVLLDPERSNDADLVRNLRASANPGLRAMGIHLALRSGDAEGAAKAAVVAMARTQGLRPDIGRPWLDWARSDAWIAALTEAWTKERGKPGGGSWPVTSWLAERGHAPALDDIRGRLSGPPSMTTGLDACAIAIGGDARDRDRAIQMFLDPRLQLERSAVPAPRMDARVGAKLGDAQRARIIDLARQETPFSPSGLRLRRALLLAAQLELPEGRALFRHIVSFVDGEQTTTTPEEQVACILALVSLKERASLPEVRLQVRSMHPIVRAAAMDALAAFQDREACARIARFVDDPTELPSPATYEWGVYTQRPIRRVWHHAMEALEKITGEKPPAGSVLQRRDFWRAWWASHRESWK